MVGRDSIKFYLLAAGLLGCGFLLSIWLSFPQLLHAAVEAYDYFDTTPSGSLNGSTGGANWETPWKSSDNSAQVQDSVTASSTAKAVKVTTGEGAARSWATTTAGMICYSTRNSTVSANQGTVTLYEGGSSKGYLGFRSDGTYSIYNQDTGTYQSIGTPSVDTWYRICVEWDDSNQNDKYRASFNGAWSAWKGLASSVTNGLTRINIGNPNTTANYYIDEICSADDCQPPTAPEEAAATSTPEIGDIFISFGLGVFGVIFILAFVLTIFVNIGRASMNLLR